MSIETKFLGGLVIIAAVVLGALWVGFDVYDRGVEDGKAVVQVKWDKDKASIQAVTDAAIANMTAQRDMALRANEVIESGYQTKLFAAHASANEFAQRLRLALAAARSSPVQQGPDKPGADGADRGPDRPGVSTLVERFTAYSSACQDGAAQLRALHAELKPQL